MVEGREQKVPLSLQGSESDTFMYNGEHYLLLGSIICRYDRAGVSVLLAMTLTTNHFWAMDHTGSEKQVLHPSAISRFGKGFNLCLIYHPLLAFVVCKDNIGLVTLYENMSFQLGVVSIQECIVEILQSGF